MARRFDEEYATLGDLRAVEKRIDELEALLEKMVSFLENVFVDYIEVETDMLDNPPSTQ